MMNPYDAWALAGWLSVEEWNAEPATVSEPYRRIVNHLAALPLESRSAAWDAYLCSVSSPDAINRALAGVDPSSPAPEVDPIKRCATLADVRLLVADTGWPWKGWLASGALNGLAADPGTGKTIFAVSLARIAWEGMFWPDGQENPFPKGTKTLWIAGDQHFAQLVALADNYGLPDEAMLFNASHDNATGGLDLDDPNGLTELGERIRTENPGIVIIDTVGMTTQKNLCKPEDARAYFTPLMELALFSGVPFLLLTHLSKDGQALGRRISGACRTVWNMTQPDPDGQPNRRRVWVEKSYLEKPPALGMTIAEHGCEFDSNPPTAPEPVKSGRPPEERGKAEAFIVNALTLENNQTWNKLKDEWEKAGGNSKTFSRAFTALEVSGRVTKEGGQGTRKQMVLHLIGITPEGDVTKVTD